MTKIIDCFVPRGNEEETKRNVDSLGAEELVNSVTVVDGNIKASATLKDIADKATTPYTVVLLKGQFIQLGYLALNRMVQVADITKAGMTYADHYNISADGKRLAQDSLALFRCIDAQMCEGVSGEELAALGGVLRRVQDNLVNMERAEACGPESREGSV